MLMIPTGLSGLSPLPGGLDSSLWTESDPRPWKEKFYEGQHNYYFVINTQALSSYTIEIRVPANIVENINFSPV